MMLFWYFNANPNPASLVKQGHGDRRDEVMLGGCCTLAVAPREIIPFTVASCRAICSIARRALRSRRAWEAPQPSRAAGDARRRRKEGSSRTPQFTSSSFSLARRSIAPRTAQPSVAAPIEFHAVVLVAVKGGAVVTLPRPSSEPPAAPQFCRHPRRFSTISPDGATQ